MNRDIVHAQSGIGGRLPPEVEGDVDYALDPVLTSGDSAIDFGTSHHDQDASKTMVIVFIGLDDSILGINMCTNKVGARLGKGHLPFETNRNSGRKRWDIKKILAGLLWFDIKVQLAR